MDLLIPSQPWALLVPQEHLKQLARYAQKLLSFMMAMPPAKMLLLRLAELCWNAALDPYVITLPSKDDPAYLLA